MEQQRPADLASLPLHDITREHGLNGLVARFNLEVAALGFPEETEQRIYKAARFARAIHATQTRGELPYVTHPFRVATRIIHYLEVQDPEIIIAALLHDTVEDKPGLVAGTNYLEAENPAYRKIGFIIIGQQFGGGVSEIVEAVTNPLYTEPTMTRHEQYRQHNIEAMEKNPRARVDRASDLIDNCGGLKYNEDPFKARRLARKYLPVLPDMRDFVTRDDTPLSDTGRKYILDHFDRAEAYCHELLAA